MTTNSGRKPGRRGNGEGSAYLRKDGRWAVDIALGGYKRKRYYFKAQKEALQACREFLNQQAQGTLATGPQRTQLRHNWSLRECFRLL